MKIGKKIIAILLAASIGASCHASVKTIELLGTAAIGAALGVASGLACKEVKENVFPVSTVGTLIVCWWLWGGIETSTIAKIGHELRFQDIACSPVLMGACLKVASYAAYFGYLDKYLERFA